ncbi:MAG: iron-sulfur cluster insertion protein ErpA [Alphaproteobacteria bacterium]|nr:iron-sulfur cluster insertion protein ErpA [Alphaproteobacteria bacterium]
MDGALPVTVSARAAAEIAKVLKEEAPGSMLRVSVSGGGCAGYQYGFSFDKDAAPDDLRIERDGVTVLIDEVSASFLKGSELDYVDELIGASFQIRNPNAKSSCGCGTSFSV